MYNENIVTKYIEDVNKYNYRYVVALKPLITEAGKLVSLCRKQMGIVHQAVHLSLDTLTKHLENLVETRNELISIQQALVTLLDNRTQIFPENINATAYTETQACHQRLIAALTIDVNNINSIVSEFANCAAAVAYLPILYIKILHPEHPHSVYAKVLANAVKQFDGSENFDPLNIDHENLRTTLYNPIAKGQYKSLVEDSVQRRPKRSELIESLTKTLFSSAGYEKTTQIEEAHNSALDTGARRPNLL